MWDFSVFAPKLKRTALVDFSSEIPMAFRIGRFIFRAEQAEPVEIQYPLEERVLTITSPGMFSKEICTTEGEYFS